MARPQGTPFGMIAKQRVDVGSQQLTYNSTVLKLSGGVQLSAKSTAQITGDSTGIVLAGAVKISNKAGGLLTANSTALLLPGGIKLSNVLSLSADSTAILSGDAPDALPGDYSTGVFQIGENSTGNWIAVRTTGTTWKYLNVTTALPT